MKNKKKGLILSMLVVLIVLAGGLYIHSQSGSTQTNISDNISAADVIKATYPIYVSDNGKYGSVHDTIFNGIGNSYAVSITRVGEAKDGTDPIEKFWIEKFEYTNPSQNKAKVYIIGTYGNDGQDRRVFNIFKEDGNILVQAESSS